VAVSGGGTATGKDIALGFIHVDTDATGANDGSSWANAYTDLVVALTSAVSGLEIWVAEGTYKPGSSRTSTFSLKNGVRVYGGFAGSETLRSGRDPDTRPTILSGDIGTVGSDTDNAYHVVTAAGAINETAILDGFTVTKGYANGGPPNERGAGLYADFNFPTIVNVVFLDNWASLAGGGVYSTGAPIRIYNSSFFGNHAGFSGGGFYGGTYAQELVNCVFSGNSSFRGGGIVMHAGAFASILRDLTIAGNSATGEGGGLWHESGISWTLTNSVFWGNTAPANPQIATWVANVPIVTYSVVQGGYTGSGSSNVLDQDPLFVDANGDDNLLGTADDDLHLQLASPAIDAGNNGAVTTDKVDLDDDRDTTETLPLDRDYNDRFIDVVGKVDTGVGTPPIVDMGAYEAAERFVDLAIDKDDGFVDLAPGQRVAYAIEATNLSGETVFAAQVSDTFPVDLSSCSWSCTAAGGAVCTAGPVAGDLNDSADIPVGGTATYVAECTVDSGATGTLANTVTIAAPAGYTDTNGGNNSSTDTDTLLTSGSCGTYPDQRTLDNVDLATTMTIGACSTVTATNTELRSGADVKFVAGERIVLGDGFHVEDSARFEAEVDPILKP
jgi:uncharacterized repeat protein (TIGR01451 family)